MHDYDHDDEYELREEDARARAIRRHRLRHPDHRDPEYDDVPFRGGYIHIGEED